MDSTTFTTLIIPIRKKLYAFALKILESEAEAEDNVQETFIRLWRMGDKLEQYRNFEGLAMQVNKNLCFDKIRTRKSNISIDNLYGITTGKTAHMDMEERQSRDIIEKIIKSLPNLQQIIIRMRDIEGYEIEDIANLTASRPESVRVNLSRARQKVREEYLKYTNRF